MRDETEDETDEELPNKKPVSSQKILIFKNEYNPLKEISEGDGEGGVERSSTFQVGYRTPPRLPNFYNQSVVLSEECHHNPRTTFRKQKQIKQESPIDRNMSKQH